jgi:hypothetical protein
MRITLARHGGFAGVRMPPVVVDTTTLPRLIGSNIERLVKAAPPPRDTVQSVPPSPDRFSFTLTISHVNGEEVHYQFDETTASSHLMALVNTLQVIGRG